VQGMNVSENVQNAPGASRLWTLPAIMAFRQSKLSETAPGIPMIGCRTVKAPCSP
jgi:hypothetical protein